MCSFNNMNKLKQGRIFILFWSFLGGHLFDHLLWSIFQSSSHNYIFQIACWATEGSFHVLYSPPVLMNCGHSSGNTNCDKEFPLLNDKCTILVWHSIHRESEKKVINLQRYLQATTAGSQARNFSREIT